MSDGESVENGAAEVDGEKTTDPAEGAREHDPGQDASAQPEPARVPVLRRVLRSRTARAVTAAGLAGALLGAGAVAWRTDTLPLVGPAPCWDSLDDAAVSGLFGDRRTEVEEQVLQPDPVGRGDSYGQCRITSYKGDRARRQVTLRVHRLDGLNGTDGHDWPAEFLAADMVSLGDGLPGMASSSRAWLALPQSCTGREDFTGPTVVDIAMGPTGLPFGPDYEREDLTALTRALVEATNGVIRDFGCSGTYRTPGTVPAPRERKQTGAADFCGVKGFTLPGAHRKDLARTVVGGDGGPARVCEAGGSYNPAVRLTTVTDAALSGIFSSGTLGAGLPVKGSKGSGSIDGTRAVYRARCQTGPVVFVVEQLDRTEHSAAGLARELLPGYVAAEAERVGCGPERVTLPGS
ncbi:hypothetical protein PUR34_24445 [Streptomyces sp. JV185]|uniref:hypothetical protein n=1 Tax=Streptomyces sp. JV185 TaxID=858638 RepID=UPI002E78FFE2|nr:hypothetical protein [Streptomyces sp. JV185]MEE1771201.1 hypothetical protein [Streptomyces sp. JV185]